MPGAPASFLAKLSRRFSSQSVAGAAVRWKARKRAGAAAMCVAVSEPAAISPASVSRSSKLRISTRYSTAPALLGGNTKPGAALHDRPHTEVQPWRERLVDAHLLTTRAVT